MLEVRFCLWCPNPSSMDEQRKRDPNTPGCVFGCGLSGGGDSLLNCLQRAGLARFLRAAERRSTCALSPRFCGIASRLSAASVQMVIAYVLVARLLLVAQRRVGDGWRQARRWLANIADPTSRARAARFAGDVCKRERRRRSREQGGDTASREREQLRNIVFQTCVLASILDRRRCAQVALEARWRRFPPPRPANALRCAAAVSLRASMAMRLLLRNSARTH